MSTRLWPAGSHGGALLITLLLTSLSWATQVEGTEVPCPDGSGDVVIHRMVAQNSAGGWDSDGARYSSGGQFREYEISTCPSGLSLRASDMGVGISPANLKAIQPLLSKFRAEAGESSLAEAPPHERHARAARLYEAMNRNDIAAQLWMSASWLARDEAVGLFTGVEGPIVARTILEVGEGELAKRLDLPSQKRVTFNLAVVAHRAGYPAIRDRYAAAMDGLRLTPPERARVQRLRTWAAVEAEYQDQAIRVLTRTLQERTGEPRWTGLFQLADLTRRRGKLVEARAFYAMVRQADQASELARFLADYFVAELDGGTPWTEGRFQTLPGVDAKPPG